MSVAETQKYNVLKLTNYRDNHNAHRVDYSASVNADGLRGLDARQIRC